MQRIIKFRAWNTIVDKMVTWEEMQLTGLDYWFNPCDLHVLMQFTGLLDKNGKDIYEGDIVRIEDGIHTGDVLWDHLTRSWRVNFGTQYFLLPNRTTVIGNIYETPELAKKEQ